MQIIISGHKAEGSSWNNFYSAQLIAGKYNTMYRAIYDTSFNHLLKRIIDGEINVRELDSWHDYIPYEKERQSEHYFKVRRKRRRMIKETKAAFKKACKFWSREQHEPGTFYNLATNRIESHGKLKTYGDK